MLDFNFAVNVLDWKNVLVTVIKKNVCKTAQMTCKLMLHVLAN